MRCSGDILHAWLQHTCPSRCACNDPSRLEGAGRNPRKAWESATTKVRPDPNFLAPSIRYDRHAIHSRSQCPVGFDGPGQSRRDTLYVATPHLSDWGHGGILRQQSGSRYPGNSSMSTRASPVYRFDDPQVDDPAESAVYQVGFSPQIGSHHDLCANST